MFFTPGLARVFLLLAEGGRIKPSSVKHLHSIMQHHRRLCSIIINIARRQNWCAYVCVFDLVPAEERTSRETAQLEKDREKELSLILTPHVELIRDQITAGMRADNVVSSVTIQTDLLFAPLTIVTSSGSSCVWEPNYLEACLQNSPNRRKLSTHTSLILGKPGKCTSYRESVWFTGVNNPRLTSDPGNYSPDLYRLR